MTKVDELLIEGKVKEAIEIMCDLPEYEKEREQYIDLFENEHYRQYEVDGILNEILLAYQQYFRDVFYCNSDEEIAADKLIRKLCQTFSISEKEKDALEDRLQELFEQKGYHALFGKRKGIWTIHLERYGSDVLSDRIAGRRRAVYGKYFKRFCISELDGLSDLWKIRNWRLGI